MKMCAGKGKENFTERIAYAAAALRREFPSSTAEASRMTVVHVAFPDFSLPDKLWCIEASVSLIPRKISIPAATSHHV